MKYLIIVYAKYNDGKPDKKSMYEETDEDNAVAAFHGYMSTYMKDQSVEHLLVEVIDINGNIPELKTFNRKH